ncbi:MAG: hypothetical protein K8F52_15720 [Candidatus Scalindua rubra]|nr:hypothetical protein [Candidatus Scalindua rubra]
MYNIDHLISTIRLGYQIGDDPWFGLAVTEKGLGAFENFVHSRYQLYLHVYSYKTVVGFKSLLEQAITELLSNDVFKKAFNDALSDISLFTTLTDATLWEGFKGVIMRKDYKNIFDRFHRIYKKYQAKYKNPDSNQICCMWSTKNPPDEIYECSQISDIEKEFKICLSELDVYELYDMKLDEATEYIIKKLETGNEENGKKTSY